MIEAKKNIVIYSDKNQVFSVSSKCYKNLKLSNNEIKISFNSLLTNSKQLFIFAQKNTVVNVTNLSDKKCFIDVEILNFIQENL